MTRRSSHPHLNTIDVREADALRCCLQTSYDRINKRSHLYPEARSCVPVRSPRHSSYSNDNSPSVVNRRYLQRICSYLLVRNISRSYHSYRHTDRPDFPSGRYAYCNHRSASRIHKIQTGNSTLRSSRCMNPPPTHSDRRLSFSRSMDHR